MLTKNQSPVFYYSFGHVWPLFRREEVNIVRTNIDTFHRVVRQAFPFCLDSLGIVEKKVHHNQARFFPNTPINHTLIFLS